MSGMMNAKRYTGCRCCTDPDDVARRQIEKREAEAEIKEEIMGWYDDSCVQCGREQAVGVEEGQTTWFCHPCEYENEVSQVD